MALHSRVLFDKREMAEEIVVLLTEKEELDLTTTNNSNSNSNSNSINVHCAKQYCPSAIRVCSVKIEGEERFILSYIPHFHNTPIYQANPRHLPPFLQLVIQLHSGLHACNEWIRQLQSTSSTSILHRLAEEKRRLFCVDCIESLRTSAMNDLGVEIGVGGEFEELFALRCMDDGK